VDRRRAFALRHSWGERAKLLAEMLVAPA
jgi:hypothetical protein